MTTVEYSAAPQTEALLQRAVHQNSAFSLEGLRERAFTMAFRQLVYPQIWEDPIIDMEALAIGPEHRILTIASGGCNALSYLTANPQHITAVDLNAAHVALNRLKIAALRNLPTHHLMFQFLGKANDIENLNLYRSMLRPVLNDSTRAYWDSRDYLGRQRIGAFTRGFYRYGLLGRFIGLGHRLAKLMDVDPAIMLTATTIEEQRDIFDRHIAPLFQRKVMRRLLNHPASLYGLGIPPQQYRALAGDREMADVVCERLRKLACDAPLRDNYFAWQAFGRCYCPDEGAALPPYLMPRHFESVRDKLSRLSIRQISITDYLAAQPAASLDRFVFLDAQDWMDDQDIRTLWRQVTRTARPGARVIFRTAGEDTILPGRVPAAILSRWDYQEEASRQWTKCDRSAIYGGFHLYTLNNEA